MAEVHIQIDKINPVDFLGINNQRLFYLKKKYPQLKILSRGTTLKIIGQDSDLGHFHQKINYIVHNLEKGIFLSDEEFTEVFEPQETLIRLQQNEHNDNSLLSDTHNYNLVLTPDRRIVQAKTEGQKKMVELSWNNDIVFAVGPAGTGKTYTAVALAVRKLKNKEIKKIILTRPAVEAGESLGYLPGDLKEKTDPYLRPLYDALEEMLPHDRLSTCLRTHIIEVAPLAYMRGRTLDNAFLILDEAQNATEAQLKMFLTRIGPNAKAIITGDLSQIDLPHNQKSGLKTTIEKLASIRGIAVIELTARDTLRHRLLTEILKAMESK